MRANTPCRTALLFPALHIEISRLLWFALFAVLAVGATARVGAQDLTVIAVQGNVRVLSGNTERAARRGATIQLAATVRTGSNSSIELRQGATTFTVASNTQLEIPATIPPGAMIDRVVQPRGSTFYDVESRERRKLRVETPYLVAVVKGTQFNVTVQNEQTVISLLEGRLEIRSPDGGDVVDLNAGEVAIRGAVDTEIRVIGSNGAERVAGANAVTEPLATASLAGRGPGATVDSITSGNLTLGPGGSASAIVDSGASERVDLAIGPVNFDAADAGSADIVAAVGIDLSGGGASGVGADMSIGASFDLSSESVSAGIDTGVNLGGTDIDVGADVGMNLESGSIDIGADAGINLVGTSVGLGADIGADLAGGSIDIGTDIGIDSGGGSADIGTNVGVDLGTGSVDLGAEIGADLSGGSGIELGADAGVDLDGNGVDLGVVAEIDSSGVGADIDVGIGSALTGGEIDLTTDAGIDIGDTGVDVGADVSTDLDSGSVDLNGGIDVGGTQVDAGINVDLDNGDIGVDLGIGDVGIDLDLGLGGGSTGSDETAPKDDGGLLEDLVGGLGGLL